ncbi:MAG: hypothetical protein J6D00_03980 [Christensenellaceae bacterium]|nr:hypothetical protein [Christensenellaceae bacterium]
MKTQLLAFLLVILLILGNSACQKADNTERIRFENIAYSGSMFSYDSALSDGAIYHNWDNAWMLSPFFVLKKTEEQKTIPYSIIPRQSVQYIRKGGDKLFVVASSSLFSSYIYSIDRDKKIDILYRSDEYISYAQAEGEYIWFKTEDAENNTVYRINANSKEVNKVFAPQGHIRFWLNHGIIWISSGNGYLEAYQSSDMEKIGSVQIPEEIWDHPEREVFSDHDTCIVYAGTGRWYIYHAKTNEVKTVQTEVLPENICLNYFDESSAVFNSKEKVYAFHMEDMTIKLLDVIEEQKALFEKLNNDKNRSHFKYFTKKDETTGQIYLVIEDDKNKVYLFNLNKE